jgi:hypothetical protein
VKYALEHGMYIVDLDPIKLAINVTGYLPNGARAIESDHSSEFYDARWFESLDIVCHTATFYLETSLGKTLTQHLKDLGIIEWNGRHFGTYFVRPTGALDCFVNDAEIRETKQVHFKQSGLSKVATGDLSYKIAVFPEDSGNDICDRRSTHDDASRMNPYALTEPDDSAGLI